ncbi:MAG: SDR family NAD(P)-dependent oxidoreductase [Legionella sp.]|jgi:hypothetical protein
MNQRTWVVLGATSIIAEHFAHLVAAEGSALRLIARNKEHLELIAADIRLRYKVPCETIILDMNDNTAHLVSILESDQELDLFIAHSDFTTNEHLTNETISRLININILATSLYIHNYLNKQQKEHNLIFLSSVAACRGRAKNSLYGASKAAIEVYLQGLQQKAAKSQRLCVARLGFIDTRQTYGQPGIFYAAPPVDCAKACLTALRKNKRQFYYPGFWGLIMGIIIRLPFFAYKKMGV